jgi:hypothetical protein
LDSLGLDNLWWRKNVSLWKPKAYKPVSLRKLLLLFSLVVSSLNVSATHLLGGEIIWKCQPNGTYKFTLVVYRDCGGITIATTPQTIANNAGVSISCAFISTTDVVPSCYTGTASCAGATSGEGRMQKYVYRSGDITLTGTPPASGWYFTWNSCCRPSTISNLVSPGGAGYLLRAVMYPYTPPGATAPLSAGTTANPTCFDSSPNFLEDPKIIACTGQNISYNNFGYDPDLDSLYYNWSYPWDASSFSANPATNSVSFAPGYSWSIPLPSGSNSIPANIDGATGEISFNTGFAGSFATCVVIEEWRCGQKIGEIYRDIPIVTLNCNPPTGLCSSSFIDSPPYFSVDLDTNYTFPISIQTDTNFFGDTSIVMVDLFPGDTINLDVIVVDSNSINPNCNWQNITFEAFGGMISQDSLYADPNDCLFNPPCATITRMDTGSGFVFQNAAHLRLSWYLDCSHIDYQMYQCGSLSSTYEMYIKLTDDQCPINRFTYKKVMVTVKNYMPGIPFVDSTSIAQTSCGAYFDWTANVDTGFNWDYYIINRVDTSGVTTVLDTVYDFSIQSYLDTTADPSSVNSYYIQSAGGCSLVSEPSVMMKTSYTIQHPLNDTVSAGQNASFEVAASQGITYQWQIKTGIGFINLSDGGQISGAQTNKLNILSTQTLNNLSEYRCIRTVGSCTDTTDIATLYVNAIGLEEEELTLKLYPNPADASITIDARQPLNEVKIYNNLGQIMYVDNRQSNSYRINTMEWPNGIYSVLIETGQGTKTLNFTVNR